jgi:hypothetical protein
LLFSVKQFYVVFMDGCTRSCTTKTCRLWIKYMTGKLGCWNKTFHY